MEMWFYHALLYYRVLFHGLFSQASHTIMNSNKSTAMFEIPRLTAEEGGLWECRVSTNGGQDSRKFNLTVKGAVNYNCKCILLQQKSEICK